MTTRPSLRLDLACSIFFILSACGDSPARVLVDAGHTADAGPGCTTDRDCDRGLFCDGPPLCLPGGPNADARGCVVLPNGPCRDAQTCAESRGECVTDCAVSRDADGTASGERVWRNHCDDADPGRFSGNTGVRRGARRRDCNRDV